MKGFRGLAGVATVALVTSCGSCKHEQSVDAGPPAAVFVSDASPAALSLPLAADQDPAGRVYAAGFVAAQNAASVSLFDAKGRLVWTAIALDALSFSSDAHLDVVATSHGAVIAWRGLRNGKRTRVGRWIGDDGKVGPSTFDVGSNACAAGDDLLSIGGKHGDSLVERRVPDGPDRTVLSIPDGVEPSLVCGDTKRAYLVEQGEVALVARPVEDGKALPRVTLLGEDDLGDDDVREREEFTTGDAFGELVFTVKGTFILRELGEPGLSPKRILERTLGPEEGFMAADANKTDIAVVVSRDASSRCDGEIATDVLAIDVPRDPARKEQSVDLAHGDCGKDLGPYWVAPTNDALYVAWQVRGRHVGNRAPVEALAWSKVGEATPHVIPMSAEDVVYAGCHPCSFVALARPEGTDGMTPGVARVIQIP